MIIRCATCGSDPWARTRSIAYLDALAAEGTMPVDLDGAVIEPVSAKHRAGAITMKAELMRKIGSSGNRSITHGA